MTLQELRTELNEKYGLDPWPATYEVDAETYGNVCRDLFKRRTKKSVGVGMYEIKFMVGVNNGPLFKGVELIMKCPVEVSPSPMTTYPFSNDTGE